MLSPCTGFPALPVIPPLIRCALELIALQSFKSPQERESALSAVQPRPFLRPLVIRRAKLTENVDPIPSSADDQGSAEVVEINCDAEDQLLVEALQEDEDSKFGADTTRMDLKPPGPTSFITPALQGYEDSKFGADTTRTSFITVPEPEQVKIMMMMSFICSCRNKNRSPSACNFKV